MRLPDAICWLMLAAGAAASAPLAAGGMDGPAGNDNAPPVSLAFDVQPVFDTWCVQCHLLESPQAGLVLENGEAWGNLVGIASTQAPLKRVQPGDPPASYLLHKLRGTQAQVGGSGQAMPYGSEPGGELPADARALIERWIAEGAADN